MTWIFLIFFSLVIGDKIKIEVEYPGVMCPNPFQKQSPFQFRRDSSDLQGLQRKESSDDQGEQNTENLKDVTLLERNY